MVYYSGKPACDHNENWMRSLRNFPVDRIRPKTCENCQGDDDDGKKKHFTTKKEPETLFVICVEPRKHKPQSFGKETGISIFLFL